MLGEEIMAGGFGEGAKAEIKAAYTADGGVTYEFKSRDEVNTFIAETAKAAARWSAAQAIGGPILAGPINSALEYFTGSYNPPSPKSYYVELGSKVSGNISAGLGITGKSSLDLTQALGVKIEPGVDGSTKPSEAATYTVSYKGTGALTGSIASVENAAEAETMVAVTYQNDKPISASIDVAGTLKNGFTGAGEVGSPINLNGQLKVPKITGVAQDVDKGKALFKLKLDNPDNNNAMADMLGSVGMPVLGEGTPGDQDVITAAGNLADRFTQAGPEGGATITAQQFEGTSASLGASAFAGDILALARRCPAGHRTLAFAPRCRVCQATVTRPIRLAYSDPESECRP